MSTTTRRLLPRAERQLVIEQAAARAFVRTGFAATSMDDVAAEAGVTKVLVYRHVDSKEGLYRSILERVSTQLREEFSAAVQADVEDPATVAHLATARHDPDGYRLLFLHAEREPAFADYAAELMTLIVAVADEIFGEAVPSRLRTWSTHFTVAMLVRGVLTWLEFGDPADDEHFRSRMSASVVASVIEIIGTD